MSDIRHTGEETFESDVIQASQPVLVDFTAVWCGPCKMLEPVIKQLALEWGEKAQVYKLDVDENPNLAMDFQVMGVPTLILFVQGKPVERASGYQPKDKLAARFSRFLVG